MGGGGVAAMVTPPYFISLRNRSFRHMCPYEANPRPPLILQAEHTTQRTGRKLCLAEADQRGYTIRSHALSRLHPEAAGDSVCARDNALSPLLPSSYPRGSNGFPKGRYEGNYAKAPYECVLHLHILYYQEYLFL